MHSNQFSTLVVKKCKAYVLASYVCCIRVHKRNIMPPDKQCNRVNDNDSGNNHSEIRKKRTYTPLSASVLSNKDLYMHNHANIPLPTIHNIVSTSKIVCIPSSHFNCKSIVQTGDTQEPSSTLSSQHSSSSATSHHDITPSTPSASYINLEYIHSVLQCSHYNRKKFAAITIRIDDPTVTTLLFTSGRLVITGSKSWYECMMASLVIVRILSKVQPECHFYVQVCLHLFVFTPLFNQTNWSPVY